MISTIPAAVQQPGLTTLKRPARTTTPVTSHPLFGSVTISGSGDQVRFGSGNPVQTTAQAHAATPVAENQPTETVEQPAPQSQAPQEKPAPKYGYFQNNLRAGMGVVFRDLMPVAMSFPVVGGFPGLLLALACIPLSYVSGKIGRHIAKDVDHDTLNPLFKYLSSARQVLTNSVSTDPNNPQGPVVDRLNEALNDAFNLRGNGGRFTNKLKSWLVPLLTLNKDSGLGRFIENFSDRYTKSLLRAEVNMRVAQSQNVGQAGVQAVKGVADWTFYSVMNKVGTWLTTFSWGWVKAIGEMMKNAGLIKIAADVVSGAPKPQNA